MVGLTDLPIRSGDLVACVAEYGCGAQALFVGSVRDTNEGRAVRAVTYDAFRPLALKELQDIAREAGERWSARVAVVHRLGRLEVGDASVAVAAAAPHRAEAFGACRYVIDEIKERLPVWKKEHYAEGESRWLEGCSLGGELEPV